jgi:hypothetical protein
MSFFFMVTDNKKAQSFYNFHSLNMFSTLLFFKRKFRYFSATFFKIDSGATIKKPPLLGFIFS